MNNYVRSGAIPSGDFSGLSVLDVGCADGWRFELPEFTKASRLVGVEPDQIAVERGKQKRPAVEFHIARAERLPFADNEFDVYMSIVSLPYADLPRALAEAYRVTRPGGRIHITMHTLPMQMQWFLTAVKGLSVKRVLDHAYIAANSAFLWMFGKCFPRPWKRSTFESFQTAGRMMRMAEKAGFQDVGVKRTRRHLIIEGWKEPDADQPR